MGQMRDAAGDVMNVAIRNGNRAAIQAEADKAAKLMSELVQKTEKGMDFAGVIPKFAKKITSSDQLAPIRAEGLDSLGN